jgi:hypothetical protein
MARNTEPPKRIQVSLRTYLLAVLAAGLTLGILGQLFRHQPELFAVVISVLSTIVPFVLAIGTVVWIGFHRSPVWSLPICASCRRDLRWLDLNEVAACPQCGADLTAPKALAFERSRYRSGRMIAWGFLLLMIPVIGIAGTILYSTVAGPGPGGLGMLSNQEVIQKRLLPQIDQPWVWRELERRLAAGKLSQEEVEDAVKVLVRHMKATKPNGWDQPFHWTDEFLKAASSADLISDSVLLDLCDAFYGTKAKLQPLPRVRENGRGFRVDVEYGNHWQSRFGAGVELLWEVSSICLENKRIHLRQLHKSESEWSGHYDGTLPAGEHVLTVEIECAYIDTKKLVGLSTKDLPAKRWPEARKQWTQTVSTPCKIYTKDEPILEPVTDFARSPRQTGGIQINRLVVQQDRDGKKMIALNVDFGPNLAVPIAFDVVVRLGDDEIRLGPMHAAMDAGWSTTSGKQLQKRIDSLDPAVREADIILTPNPRNLERDPRVSEFWGEKVVFPKVPLDRFDLEE